MRLIRNGLVSPPRPRLVGAARLPPAHAQPPTPCKLEITGNDPIQYDKKQLTIAADCTQVDRSP